MSGYRLREIVVLTLGFFLGAGLAISIAPGDVLLWIMTGVVLGFFTHAFFVESLGGNLAWPAGGILAFGRRRRAPYVPVRHEAWVRKPRHHGTPTGTNRTTFTPTGRQAKRLRKQRLREMNRQASHPQTGRPLMHQEHPTKVT